MDRLSLPHLLPNLSLIHPCRSSQQLLVEAIHSPILTYLVYNTRSIASFETKRRFYSISANLTFESIRIFAAANFRQFPLLILLLVSRISLAAAITGELQWYTWSSKKPTHNNYFNLFNLFSIWKQLSKVHCNNFINWQINIIGNNVE